QESDRLRGWPWAFCHRCSGFSGEGKKRESRNSCGLSASGYNQSFLNVRGGMKLLVTGGAGFIGSHLVDRLVQEGHEVIIVDNLATGKRRNINRAARFYKLDVQSWRLERVFRNERPHVVMHLAAQMDVRKSVEDPMFDAQVNILGTLNVLEQAVKHGVRKVVFASSG